MVPKTGKKLINQPTSHYCLQFTKSPRNWQEVRSFLSHEENRGFKWNKEAFKTSVDYAPSHSSNNCFGDGRQ